MTQEERLERLEWRMANVEQVLRGELPVTLEEQHAATVAKVKAAKERGGLKA